MLNPDLRTPDLNAKLDQLARALPDGVPQSVRTVGAQPVELLEQGQRQGPIRSARPASEAQRRRGQRYDSSFTSASGWMGSAASPATPISTPKKVGTSAAKNSGHRPVSAVTASSAMAMASSASDRSNWSSR